MFRARPNGPLVFPPFSSSKNPWASCQRRLCHTSNMPPVSTSCLCCPRDSCQPPAQESSLPLCSCTAWSLTASTSLTQVSQCNQGTGRGTLMFSIYAFEKMQYGPECRGPENPKDEREANAVSRGVEVACHSHLLGACFHIRTI